MFKIISSLAVILHVEQYFIFLLRSFCRSLICDCAVAIQPWVCCISITDAELHCRGLPHFAQQPDTADLRENSLFNFNSPPNLPKHL